MIVGRKKIKTTLLSLLLFILSTTVALGAEAGLEVNWPASPTGEELEMGTTGIASLVKYFYEWGIVIGIIALFATLVYAGVQYLTSAGNPQRMKDAKSKIVSGFSGVILLLGSWILLNTINPELTEIRTADFDVSQAMQHEFSQAPAGTEDGCEFSLITTTEEDENTEETYLAIPGVTRKFDGIFPEQSRACSPEKDPKRILEVREYVEQDKEDKTTYMRLFNRKGRMLTEEDQGDLYEDTLQIKVTEDNLGDLYKERYEKVNTQLELEKQKTNPIPPSWAANAEKGIFNTIYKPEGEDAKGCEFLITQSDFDKIRCIELEGEGSSATLTEWKKKGFPSLLPYLDYLQNQGDEGLFSQPVGQTCPGPKDLDSDDQELGYKRDESGGGCNWSFYRGEETSWWNIGGMFGTTSVCKDQVSRVSADMENFSGTVDDEITCLEFNRSESPIDTEAMPSYTLTLKVNYFSCEAANHNETVCNKAQSKPGTIEVLEDGSNKLTVKEDDDLKEDMDTFTKDIQIEAQKPVTIKGTAKPIGALLGDPPQPGDPTKIYEPARELNIPPEQKNCEYDYASKPSIPDHHTTEDDKLLVKCRFHMKKDTKVSILYHYINPHPNADE